MLLPLLYTSPQHFHPILTTPLPHLPYRTIPHHNVPLLPAPLHAQVDKLDCLVWLASFFGVLFISVEIGLAIAIGMAVLMVVWRSAFPQVKLLGRVGNSVSVGKWEVQWFLCVRGL